MISEEAIVQAVRNAVPKEVLSLSSIMKEHGHRCWIVGGSVRDILLDLEAGRAPERQGDWDLATSAHPQEVKKIFRRVIPTGIDHGTVTVVLNRQHFEVTTLRGEKGHSDGRRPDEVFYVDDLSEDLARRDFTVNAMAISLEEGAFFDPFNGRQDLSKRLLRAVGDPNRRFSEDGLRILRCARFCSTLNFSIESGTRAAIAPSLPTFEKVARERVRDEWFKAFRALAPSLFLRVLRDEGMLHKTLAALWPNELPTEAFEAALSKVDAAPREPTLRLALLVSLQFTPEEGSQQKAAMTLAKSLGRTLKLSRKELERIHVLSSHAHLPAALLNHYEEEDARRWLAEVGREQAPSLLDFQRLAFPVTLSGLEKAHEGLRQQLASACPLSAGELALNGGDLIKKGIVKKGPLVGQALRHLLDAVLSQPERNDRAQLLELARTFVSD